MCFLSFYLWWFHVLLFVLALLSTKPPSLSFIQSPLLLPPPPSSFIISSSLHSYKSIWSFDWLIFINKILIFPPKIDGKCWLKFFKISWLLEMFFYLSCNFLIKEFKIYLLFFFLKSIKFCIFSLKLFCVCLFFLF